LALTLSVIIPSHNRPDLLRTCLASLACHAPPGTEILVVDDGSPGGSVSRAAADFPAVHCLRRPQQGGFCAAVNEGLRHARHPIAQLLNDDAEVTPGWADAPLAHFADPQVAAVAPLVLQRRGGEADGPPVIDSAGDRYYLGGVAAKRGHGQPLGPDHLRPGPVFGASASSAFYRRELVLRVGAFPDSFSAYFEDVDLSFRLQRAGGRILFEPASRVLHRVSASYGPPCRRLLAQQSRNEELVFWRNLPARDLTRALPLHLAVLAGKAWRRARQGLLIPFLAGRLAALAAWPDILAHRRRLTALGPERPARHWYVEGAFWRA